MNGLVTRNTWFHILAGLMTVGLKLANYLMCLRGFFHHLAINQWFVWFFILLCSGQRESQAATRGFWYLAGYTFGELDIKLLQFKFCWNNWFFFFLLIYIYWLFLMHCVLSWDFEESSCYSMDSKSLFTAKKCLRPIQKQGASMNGYTVCIFSFYPIFYRWFLCWKSAMPWIGFLSLYGYFMLPYFFQTFFMLKKCNS